MDRANGRSRRAWGGAPAVVAAAAVGSIAALTAGATGAARFQVPPGITFSPTRSAGPVAATAPEAGAGTATSVEPAGLPRPASVFLSTDPRVLPAAPAAATATSEAITPTAGSGWAAPAALSVSDQAPVAVPAAPEQITGHFRDVAAGTSGTTSTGKGPGAPGAPTEAAAPATPSTAKGEAGTARPAHGGQAAQAESPGRSGAPHPQAGASQPAATRAQPAPSQGAATGSQPGSPSVVPAEYPVVNAQAATPPAHQMATPPSSRAAGPARWAPGTDGPSADRSHEGRHASSRSGDHRSRGTAGHR